MMLAGCAKPSVVITSYDGLTKVTLPVEVADAPGSRARGLMERKELPPDTGMLFVFPDPDMLSFWMKDTLIPLEVIFFDRDGAFVSASRMEPCKEDPCMQYSSQAQSQYALEVSPDFRQKHGIGVGWRLDLSSVRKISRPR
jgi:uncharacterized membrane protein (UPF0127 family)